MNVISQDAFAKIAVNKSLLKEYSSSKYDRVVYLNDGDEFQIQLFNPEKHVIAAKIYLNGEELSDMLVLRPGERVWLERYLNEARKFKFSTYEIENSYEATEAASLNGEVKVEFYRVKTPKKNNGILYTYPPISVYYNSLNDSGYQIKGISEPTSICCSNSNVSYASSISCGDAGESSCSFASTSTSDSYDYSTFTASVSLESAVPISASAKKSADTIETGRVEEGSYSNQKFSYVNYDFESWPFRTETISLLPTSRKPMTSSDLKKRYCSNCGRKLSPKHKFCPYCGTKVD